MPNKIYYAEETTILFADSAQTPDEPLSLASLAAGAARISDRYDIGAGSKSRWYKWDASITFATAPTAGETVDLYLSTSRLSGDTTGTGDEGITDANVGNLDSLKQMTYIGSIPLKATLADQIDYGFFLLNTRFFSVVVHNNTAGDAFSATTTVSNVNITPIPSEIQ